LNSFTVGAPDQGLRPPSTVDGAHRRPPRGVVCDAASHRHMRHRCWPSSRPAAFGRCRSPWPRVHKRGKAQHEGDEPPLLTSRSPSRRTRRRIGPPKIRRSTRRSASLWMSRTGNVMPSTATPLGPTTGYLTTGTANSRLEGGGGSTSTLGRDLAACASCRDRFSQKASWFFAPISMASGSRPPASLSDVTGIRKRQRPPTVATSAPSTSFPRSCQSKIALASPPRLPARAGMLSCQPSAAGVWIAVEAMPSALPAGEPSSGRARGTVLGSTAPGQRARRAAPAVPRRPARLTVQPRLRHGNHRASRGSVPYARPASAPDTLSPARPHPCRPGATLRFVVNLLVSPVLVIRSWSVRFGAAGSTPSGDRSTADFFSATDLADHRRSDRSGTVPWLSGSPPLRHTAASTPARGVGSVRHAGVHACQDRGRGTAIRPATSDDLSADADASVTGTARSPRTTLVLSGSPGS